MPSATVEAGASGLSDGGSDLAPIGDGASTHEAQRRGVGLRVLVIDDHPVVADALASRLRIEVDVVAVTTESDPDAALGAIERSQPDVVVWDLELGDLDGITLLRKAQQRFPRTRAVVVTAHDEPRVAAAAVRAGAVAFVSKGAPSASLATAVIGAALGESHIDPRLLYEMLPLLRQSMGTGVVDARLERLSPREREVLDHMVAGEDRATIARALFVSVNTVRTHAKNILAKLEVHSTLEAVRVAVEAGMRPPERDADDTIDAGPGWRRASEHPR